MLLKTKYKQMLLDLFSEVILPIEVWAYGSRVKGTAHDGSDLDLVIMTKDGNKIPIELLIELKEKIRDSNVPILVDLFDWAREVETRGAGEILFTSMDNDGTKSGFANETLNKLSRIVNIPIIASGGAGNMQDFADAFIDGKADAVLAASVFHFHEIEIPILKQELKKQKIEVRI